MKKLTCILMSLLLIFTLISCNNNAGNDISDNDDNESTSDTTRNNTNDKKPESTETKDTSANPDKPNNSTSTPPANNNDKNNNSASLKDIDNGVLKKASAQSMNIPENLKNLENSTATEENNKKKITATAVQYTLDGNIVNWATENDFIYVITEGNNRLVIIDSNKMSPVYNTPLAGVPAEMNIIGDLIYISLPDLCRIDIFSKADCKKEGSLYFDHEVSSFCLDGDYIYYSEHDQHCKVFKKNLITNTLTQIKDGNIYSFYYPKLYLNKEDRILYIGERGSTGSGIYYFDADTLRLKSEFKKNDYGIFNHTREIFHIENVIFWGNYCLSDTNAKQIVGRYGTADYGSVTFASKQLVSTYEGIFLADTYECIIDYDDSNFKYEYILVSNSYNVFFRKRGFDEKVIIGINFDVQKIETL